MRPLLILVLSIITLSVSAQFRNTTWGMTASEVKEIEQEKLVRTYEIPSIKLKYELIFQIRTN